MAVSRRWLSSMSIEWDGERATRQVDAVSLAGEQAGGRCVAGTGRQRQRQQERLGALVLVLQVTLGCGEVSSFGSNDIDSKYHKPNIPPSVVSLSI